MKVLVVDDEQPIVDAVTYSLRKEGFQTLAAYDADQCLELVRTESPDLLILDVMLPSASGFDVCRVLRGQREIPIIMLTARAEETDRVVGLELGADDYVTKPFSMRELVARVKSVLRRTSVADMRSREEVLRSGPVEIDGAKHVVTVRGSVVDLAPKEYELLRFLVRNAGQVFSRQVLLDRVWGADAFVGDRTVDVHIRWLREKIEADPSNPRLLQTVRGVGYRYAPAE
jgi:phosphate regulon transcriptional regulator PhoB